MTATWKIKAGKTNYTKKQKALIKLLETDLSERMKKILPQRYEHSLSVARTAERMALIYEVDPYLARVAGILHDWDKVLSPDRQMELADELGIDLGVDYSLVRPILHGLTAAKTLPERYPELPGEVWQAIARHTLGAADMSPLDMVIFVADGIEPLRRDVEPIKRVRAMVDAKAPLDEVYWTSFSQGVSYVIDTERYLYPGTLEIYNEIVLRRRAARNRR